MGDKDTAPRGDVMNGQIVNDRGEITVDEFGSDYTYYNGAYYNDDRSLEPGSILDIDYHTMDAYDCITDKSGSYHIDLAVNVMNDGTVNEQYIYEKDTMATARYDIQIETYPRDEYDEPLPPLEPVNVTVDGYGRMYDEHGEVMRDEEGHAIHFTQNLGEGRVLYDPTLDNPDSVNSVMTVKFKEYAPPLEQNHYRGPEQERETSRETSEQREEPSVSRESHQFSRGENLELHMETVNYERVLTNEDHSVMIMQVPSGPNGTVDEREIDERDIDAMSRYMVTSPTTGETITIDGYGRTYDKFGNVERDLNGNAVHYSETHGINPDNARYTFKEIAKPLTPEHEKDRSNEREASLTPNSEVKVDRESSEHTEVLTDERNSFTIFNHGTMSASIERTIDGQTVTIPGPQSGVDENRIDEHSLKSMARYEMRSDSLSDFRDESNLRITVDGNGRVFDEKGDVVRDEEGHAIHFSAISAAHMPEVAASELRIEFKGFAPPLTPNHEQNPYNRDSRENHEVAQEKIYGSNGKEITIPRDSENQQRSHTFHNREEGRSESLFSRISSGINKIFGREKDEPQAEREEKEKPEERPLSERLEESCRQAMDRYSGGEPQNEPEHDEHVMEIQHERTAGPEVEAPEL